MRNLFIKFSQLFWWSTYFRHLFYVCLILKSFNMLFSNNKCWPFWIFLFKWCPLLLAWFSYYTHRWSRKLWLQPQHYHIAINSLGYDCHILPFKNVEAEEYIEHFNNKEEEGIKDDRGRVIASHNVWARKYVNITLFSCIVVFHCKFSILHGPPLSYLHGN